MKFATLLPILSLTTPILAVSDTIVGNLKELTQATVLVQTTLDAWDGEIRETLNVMNKINLLESQIYEARSVAKKSKAVDAKGADAIVAEAKVWGKQLNTTLGVVIRRKPEFLNAKFGELMLEYTTDSRDTNKKFLEETLKKVPKSYGGKVKDAWAASLTAYSKVVAAYKN